MKESEMRDEIHRQLYSKRDEYPSVRKEVALTNQVKKLGGATIRL